MKCNHEITLYTGKKIDIDGDGRLEDLLTCARCSTVVQKNGRYSRVQNAMAEVYQGKGLYKRYKVYKLKDESGLEKRAK